MEQRNITFAPALYKIFDEVLVNAADHSARNPPPAVKGPSAPLHMSTLKVVVDEVRPSSGAVGADSSACSDPVADLHVLTSACRRHHCLRSQYMSAAAGGVVPGQHREGIIV